MDSRVIAYGGLLLLLMMLLATSCSSQQPWDYATDHAGNKWPEKCRQDLSSVVAADRVNILYMPREALTAAYGRNVDGLTWSFGVKGDEIIWLANDLREPLHTAVKQHELCHLGEYGGVGWHK